MMNTGRKKERKTAGKLHKLFVRSFPKLRVMFGATNFVDKTTPLKFFDFNIKRVVDLLLVDK